MKTEHELKDKLNSIDHRGYPAYKDLAGYWKFENYVLAIDHVQGDPFAAPSSLHVEIDSRTAGFPPEYYESPWRKRMLEDCLVRRFAKFSRQFSLTSGSGKSGLIESSRPGQEVLTRSACEVGPRGNVIFRFHAGLPANGRSINARACGHIFFESIPGIVYNALLYSKSDKKYLNSCIELADDQHAVRESLDKMGLVSFIADGSVLPRESGISERPMKGAVPFISPESLRVSVKLPHRGIISGMGIKRGVTLIVGGGYHGKSTLLSAIMLGVYDHIPGDGRELAITEDTAVKIRAEDGRSVAGDDISLFINNLPDGSDSRDFFTENASGSTSQAAGTVEAIEAGAKTLLVDEDTSATNFMMRDVLMKKVIPDDEEPITPFFEKIRPLWKEAGISTVLVAGSFGAYFEAADTIIQMDHYRVKDITSRAKAALYETAEEKMSDSGNSARTSGTDMKNSDKGTDTARNSVRFARIPQRSQEFGGGDRRLKIRPSGLEGFSVGYDRVDLRFVEQLIDPEQSETLALALKFLETHIFDGRKTVRECVNELTTLINKNGIDVLADGARAVPLMTAVRPQEIFAAVNRYRKLKMKSVHVI